MSQSKPKRAVGSTIRRPLLAGALAAAAVTPVSAVADIFLNLPGVPGESTAVGHKTEINILSYTQSFKNTPAVGGAGAGKVTCGDITLLKNIDKSSPQLIKAVTTGQHFDKAVITFRAATATGKAATDYYTVALQDILITSIDQTDQPDAARIVERVSLNAKQFEFKYRLGAVDFKFDCSQVNAQ